MEVPQNKGYLLGGPHNKDYSVLGGVLGFPYFGKLPFRVQWDPASFERLEHVLSLELVGDHRSQPAMNAR